METERYLVNINQNGFFRLCNFKTLCSIPSRTTYKHREAANFGRVTAEIVGAALIELIKINKCFKNYQQTEFSALKFFVFLLQLVI